jgi:hephaestin
MRMSRWVVLGGVVVAAIIVAGWNIAQGAYSPRERIYYIAADTLTWDYAPGGVDAISGQDPTPFGELFLRSGKKQIGTRYKKVLYREYTDSTFTQLKPRPAEWEHLGALGPLVRAVVGDTIRVVFRNNGPHPFSLHPHGVFYDKRSEGAPYQDGTAAADGVDDGVPPGGTHVYVWPVPERAGPTTHEGSSAFWMYHSHTAETRDVNSGLIGPMIVTAAGRARPDGTPDDIDREIIVGFNEIDENDSWFFEENLTTYASEPESVTPAERFSFASTFFVSNLRETINGWSFGHTPKFTMHVGERVRWYTMSATNFEIHAPHWHGNTVIVNGMRTDVTALLPMGMMIADMVPDNPGTWLIHCHVAPHLNAGMQARFVVAPALSVAR